MHETMRAAVIDGPGEPGVFRVADFAVPDRVSAEFLVKVVAAGVNPIDAKTRAGRGVFGAIRHFPSVLGQDFSGVVVQSPYEAHPIKPGDEVFGMVMVPRFGGAYAEYVTVPSISVVRKPSTLSHIEAAGRTGRRADRLGHGRRGGEGARRAADAHPRRQRRRRSLRGAVRLILRRARDRDVLGTQPRLAARARRIRGHRLREHALRGCRVGGGRRHRPGRQRARRHRARAR